MFQAPADSGIHDNYSYYGNYEVPFYTPRLRLGVFGAYSKYDIGSEGGGIDFRGRGSAYGGTLRFNAFQAGGWFFDITGSISRENSKSTPSLFPAALEYDIDMDLYGVGFDIHRSDDMSNSAITFTRTESFDASSKAEFTTARTGTTPDFTIYTTTANHSQFLDPNKVNRISGTFRWMTSDERLVPAKMTTFGGLYTVRGYEEDQVVADGGILASVQYEFDLVKYGEAMDKAKKPQAEAEAKGKKPFLRKLAPLGFFDYGRARIVDHLASEKEITKLSSAGVGAVVELGDNFSGGVYYGIPLQETDDTDKGDGRVNVNLIMRW